MMKLGGAGNIADSTRPPQIDTRQRAVATTIARIGVVVTIVAVAEHRHEKLLHEWWQVVWRSSC